MTNPGQSNIEVLREHARREHVGAQRADCRACQKFPEAPTRMACGICNGGGRLFVGTSYQQMCPNCKGTGR
jgi:hypothetical protein